jgi:hypothetical protein
MEALIQTMLNIFIYMKDATLHACANISTLDINDYNSGILFGTVTDITLSITAYFDSVCMP